MNRALIGYGGHAREVMVQMNENLVCFVDDKYVVNGVRPLSDFDPSEFEVMVAVANSTQRQEIVKRLPQNTKFFSWIHPTALIMDKNVEIGEGSFVGAYSILTTNIKVGRHALLNRGNQIGHDCVIDDFFSAMPGAIVSGNVSLGECVYMGNNSSIREKLRIHSNTTIGMNSAVVKNIEESGTYVGTPVKKL